jgi:hypothetical protein
MWLVEIAGILFYASSVFPIKGTMYCVPYMDCPRNVNNLAKI